MIVKKGILPILSAVILFVSCTGKNASQEGKSASVNTDLKKDTIIFGITDEVMGLFNPLIATKTTDQDVNRVIYASLLTVNSKGEFEPYLAERYEIDNLSFTFHLRENARWHDGTPVTAEDVAFTFDCIMDPNFTGTSYNKIAKISGASARHNGTAESVEGIKIIDEKTITFQLESPYAPAFTDIAARGIIPKHIWGNIPVGEFQNQTDLMKNPIGCGPYKVVEYIEGQQVKMTANETFFMGMPKTKNFIIKMLKADSIPAEYKNNTIDFVTVKDLTSDDIHTLTKDMGLKIVRFPNNVYRYIGINLRQEIFQDKNLREALIYAINRKQIVETLLEGNGTMIDAPFLPAGWAKADESKLTIRNYDPEKAKRLLKEGGYTDTDGDGILENPQGKKLSFVYKIPSDTALTEQVALIVQQNWKAIGIDAQLKVLSYKKVAEEAIFNHDFDFYTLNCQFGFDPDIKQWWHSSVATDEAGVPSWNFDGFKNAELDELVTQANETLRQDERKLLYNESARVISQEAPMIFLYVQDNAYAY